MGPGNGRGVRGDGSRDVTNRSKVRLPASRPSEARARVKLQRITCDYSRPYPPDGQEKEWWDRLMRALGTTSSAFVNATLGQIQNASRLPGGGVSETSVNAVLAFIEAAKPRDEVEAGLCIQMACCHAVCPTSALMRQNW